MCSQCQLCNEHHQTTSIFKHPVYYAGAYMSQYLKFPIFYHKHTKTDSIRYTRRNHSIYIYILTNIIALSRAYHNDTNDIIKNTRKINKTLSREKKNKKQKINLGPHIVKRNIRVDPATKGIHGSEVCIGIRNDAMI